MRWINFTQTPKIAIAALLILAIFAVSIPTPARAQAGALTAGVSCFFGTAAGAATAGGGALIGAAGAGLGLVVPVADVLNAPNIAVTAAKTTALNAKSIADCLATALLKAAIALVRDMVIRWIITGRFESPVFSGSFTIDAAKIAENASRIFLSSITGINLCAGFGIPSVPTFSFDVNFGLSCTLPPDFNTNNFFINAANNTDLARFLATQPESSYAQTLVRAAQAKAETEAKAVSGFAAEYQAGQGFLGVRDPKTGKITTPGSAVAELVMQSQIVSPIRQTDVADDIQTAIAAIIDTAIRVLLEKGLGQVFGP